MTRSVQRFIFLGFTAALLLGVGSGNTARAQDDMECGGEFDFPPGTRLVTVGFWVNDGTPESCSGEPICKIPFPVDYGDEECFAWPGRSGENSATHFSCGEKSFSYTQWTTLTCSGGEVPEGTFKPVYTDQCNPDTPDTLRSRILDFSGCEEGDKS